MVRSERGKQEKDCLDQVNDLFSQSKVSYIGTREDYLFIKEAFGNAVPNSASSEFPDFLFKGGFIEHFQVTSTMENKKGSEFKKKQNLFHQECEEKETAIKNEPYSSFPPVGTCTLTCCTMKMESPDSSYENYRKSFKKNWDHHIDSRKACALKGKSVFLIEMVGNPIIVKENGAFKQFYKLADDKDILEYMYKFKEEVEYVVFTYSDQCEVVSISENPNNKELLPENISFGVGNHNQVKLSLFLDFN